MYCGCLWGCVWPGCVSIGNKSLNIPRVRTDSQVSLLQQCTQLLEILRLIVHHRLEDTTLMYSFQLIVQRMYSMVRLGRFCSHLSFWRITGVRYRSNALDKDEGAETQQLSIVLKTYSDTHLDSPCLMSSFTPDLNQIKSTQVDTHSFPLK